MNYRPKSNIIYGDINLSHYDAFAFYCNVFDKPVRNVDVIQIPGKDGDIIMDNGRYNNVERSYIIQIHGVENAKALLGKLSSTVGYKRLTDEYDPDIYFEARLKSVPTIDRWVGEYVRAKVVFDRKPYKKYLSGDIPATITGRTWNSRHTYYIVEYSLNNPGEIAFPVIELTPLRNNDTAFTINYTWNGGSVVDIGHTHQSSNPDLVPKWSEESYTYVLDCEKGLFYNKNISTLMPTVIQNQGEQCFPYIRKGASTYRIYISADIDSSGQVIDPVGDDAIVLEPVLYPRWRTL